jgi:hypothetical protein
MRLLKILSVAALVLMVVLLFHNGPKQLAPGYNSATELKIDGVIAQLQQYWCPINGDEGTHFLLNTGNGILEVHVAPRRFLEGNGVHFSQGDQISVVGSMVTYQGHEAMIARKITRGDQTFAVRQPDGRPLWVERERSYVR